MISVLGVWFGSLGARAAPAPGAIPRTEVLAVGRRAVALKQYVEGTVDCRYPGLPARAGWSIDLLWDDGLHETFPVQGAAYSAVDSGIEAVPCRTPAQAASLQAAADRAIAGAGLTIGGPAAWYPRSDAPATLAGGRVLTSTAGDAPAGDQTDDDDAVAMEVVVRVDGVPAARIVWQRWVGAPAGTPGTLLLGVAEQGPRAAAVFAVGFGEPGDAVWAVPLDPAHPLSSARPVRPLPPLEVQAVDLQRGLYAYRRFVRAQSGTCPYPGAADRGVVLGVGSLRTGHAAETVVYDPPGSGVPCTSADEAARRLAAAKVRSTELGLERVVSGAPGCRTGLGEWTFDRHALRIAAGGVTWDGAVLTPQPDGAMVCVDHGLVVYGYPSGNGYWGEPFPVDAPRTSR